MANYWGYRICTEDSPFFWEEIQAGRLRQGWGYKPEHNLKDSKADDGSRRNMRMLQVKKGDYILVPRVPEWDDVCILEATEDWYTGYRFEIPERYGDYGHIFPVKLIKAFNRHHLNVSADIRSTLKNVGRFWNINHVKESVDKILLSDQQHSERAYTKNTFEGSLNEAFNQSFNERYFADKLFENLCRNNNAAEWEDTLTLGLRSLFPAPFEVKKTGGTTEVHHGTDILISFQSPFSEIKHAIAIQVKDYKDIVGTAVISQINKADKYWESQGYNIIEKVVIVTRADKTTNRSLTEQAPDIHFIFDDNLKEILSNIGLHYKGIL